MSILVHLQQFEGPLGLLLYLIRKDEMDIFDINIHQITTQYFEYIKKMKEFDLEVAGDFVQMAATLIQIKSQMLLPQYNAQGEEVAADDPRKELVSRLLEYQAFQEAAKNLNERPLLGRDLWARGNKEVHLPEGDPEIQIEGEPLFSLITLYRKSIKKMQSAVHKVSTNTLSIAGRILQLKEQLVSGTRVVMSSLFSEKEPAALRYQVLITFISMLELAKLGFVQLFQNEDQDDIHVTTLKPIERNVVERVQEYDSEGSEELANKIMDEAEQHLEVQLAELDMDSHDSEEKEDAGLEMASDEDIDIAEAELVAQSAEPAPMINLQPEEEAT